MSAWADFSPRTFSGFSFAIQRCISFYINHSEEINILKQLLFQTVQLLFFSQQYTLHRSVQVFVGECVSSQ